MSFSESRLMTIPEIAVIAATRGIIGLGAGLLLAGRLTNERRKIIGWSLFLSGVASTIPIAMRVFGKTPEVKSQARSN